MLDVTAEVRKAVGESGLKNGLVIAYVIQASLMGSSVTVIVEEGRLVLGTRQSVFFCEFDGPRARKLHVNLLANGSA